MVTRGGFRLDLTLAVDAGEVLAVLGPNGAGKSTLLRALAGLAPLDAGEIHLAGEPVDSPAAGLFVPPERRPVGVVFQDHLLFPHLTVVENVAFGPRCRGVGRRAAREQATGWLSRLGLADHADR
ncbi:MAG TPA: ATP-binding cassette domain-containing protein, partial [Micromonospora sp.]